MFKLTLACVFLFIASLEARKGNSASFLFHTVHDQSNHPGLGSSSRLTFKSVDEIRRCTIHLKATEMLFHVWLFSRVSNDIFVNFVFLLIIVNIIIMATLEPKSSDPI